MNSVMVQASSGAYVSTDTNMASILVSPTFAMQGNKAVLSLIVNNKKGTSPSLTCQMRGSYDGAAWENIGSGVTLTDFSQKTEAVGSLGYAFLQVIATFTGTTAAILFDATVAMSQQ